MGKDFETLGISLMGGRLCKIVVGVSNVSDDLCVLCLTDMRLKEKDGIDVLELLSAADMRGGKSRVGILRVLGRG